MGVFYVAGSNLVPGKKIKTFSIQKIIPDTIGYSYTSVPPARITFGFQKALLLEHDWAPFMEPREHNISKQDFLFPELFLFLSKISGRFQDFFEK